MAVANPVSAGALVTTAEAEVHVAQPKVEVVAESPAQRRSSIALIGLLVIAVMAVLYLARTVFIPVTVALLFSFLFRPVVRWLKRWHVPKAVGAAAVLISLAAVFGVGITYLAAPAKAWVERIPHSMPQIQGKLRILLKPMENVAAAAKQVDDLTTQSSNKLQVEVANGGLSQSLLWGTQEVVAGILITSVLLFFLLASGDTVLGRIARLFPRSGMASGAVELGRKEQDDAQGLLTEAEQQMTAYLGTITAINIGLGVVLGVAMHLCGMPNAVLWGVIGCLLNYIPYFGNILGIVLVGAASLLTFDSVGAALTPPLIYAAVTVVESNVVTPWLLSRRFAMDPVVTLLWTLLWTWLWGVTGGFMAVPILAFIKVISERVPALRRLASVLES